MPFCSIERKFQQDFILKFALSCIALKAKNWSNMSANERKFLRSFAPICANPIETERQWAQLGAISIWYQIYVYDYERKYTDNAGKTDNKDTDYNGEKNTKNNLKKRTTMNKDIAQTKRSKLRTTGTAGQKE